MEMGVIMYFAFSYDKQSERESRGGEGTLNTVVKCTWKVTESS